MCVCASCRVFPVLTLSRCVCFSALSAATRGRVQAIIRVHLRLDTCLDFLPRPWTFRGAVMAQLADSWTFVCVVYWRGPELFSCGVF